MQSKAVAIRTHMGVDPYGHIRHLGLITSPLLNPYVLYKCLL